MGYIQTMRRKIGHDPLIVVGASVILVNAEGWVLLQRRADNGMWGYHGGCVELFENVEDAARRELYEETGLTAGGMALFGVFSGPELDFTYPNGDRVSVVDCVYLCRDYSGTPRMQREEVTELGWFSPRALPAEITSANRPALRKWAEGAADMR
ncbi:MAG: NUDIX hydrolase [Clostridia bacterium]|nr:NUDIX hydrolase [Clostridia bacterium]